MQSENTLGQLLTGEIGFEDVTGSCDRIEVPETKKPKVELNDNWKNISEALKMLHITMPDEVVKTYLDKHYHKEEVTFRSWNEAGAGFEIDGQSAIYYRTTQGFSWFMDGKRIRNEATITRKLTQINES